MKPLVLIFCACLFALLPANDALAQQKRPENLPKYDLAPYHFGFTLGFNSTFAVIKPKEDFSSQDTIYVVEAEPGAGFNIGIVANLRLAEYADLRFIPTLSFGDRIFVFTRKFQDSIYFDTKKQVESAYINLPFEIKYKAKRIFNSRAYILGGVNFSIDLASQAKKKENDEEIRMKMSRNDVALEAGVGFDFYTNYFKFGTELKMIYGVRDMLVHEPNIYAQSIDKITTKVFMVSFTFE